MKVNKWKLSKRLLMLTLVLNPLMLNAQTYLTITKKRSPVMDFRTYKQVAIGDINGAVGAKNANSMTLSDELTAKLFNAQTFEVVDRNALVEILAGQKRTDIKLINETTTAALSKKLNSALLITGRLQNEIITQSLKEEPSGIAGCPKRYWWEATSNYTVQLKIIDVKTGKLLYSNPVQLKKINYSTKVCEITKKFDNEILIQQHIPLVADEIAKLIIPYNEDLLLTFEDPPLTTMIFKNPFKKLPQAISFFKIEDNEKGLAILKEIADNGSLKDNMKAKAYYNYAVGLLIAKQYDLSKEYAKRAMSFQSGNPLYSALVEMADREKSLDQRLLKL